MLKTKTQFITMSALLVAVTAVCAQIMLPLGTVQFSMQVFAVYLAASLLPPSWAFASMTAYLLLGVVGAPVFGGFRGGPQVIFGVTGGFIIAFPFVALYIALLVKRLRLQSALPLFAAMVSSLVILYVIGVLWFCMVSGATTNAALSAAVIPFIIPDLLKAAGAAWLAPVLKRRLKGR